MYNIEKINVRTGLIHKTSTPSKDNEDFIYLAYKLASRYRNTCSVAMAVV